MDALLIEHSPEYALEVEGMLSDELDDGIQVTVSETMEQANWDLHFRSPDCILLDLALPDADGLDALAEIRQVAPEAPIVVLTASDDESLAIKAARSAPHGELRTYPGVDHFDIYDGPEHEAVMADEVDFLSRHLLPG